MSIQSNIESKLNAKLQPGYLEVVNESHQHNVPKGSESHFKVTIVCDDFDGLTLIKRHRIINDILKDELAEQIHALALHTYTVSEWAKLNSQTPETPNCRGGFHK